MWKRFASIALLLAAVQFTFAADDEPTLQIGDDAPELKLSKFIKGDEVKSFAKGKIYIVEFWATWCGPCLRAMPHLTELQAKHKDISIIGVNVLDDVQESVPAFVKANGERMGYAIALDTVPKGKDPDEGLMVINWLTAAGQDGIPASFVVNGDGKIAWIGHPLEIDEPLEKILKGNWDLKTARAEATKTRQRIARLTELIEAIRELDDEGDTKKILKLIDAAITEDPAIEEKLALYRFSFLAGPDGDEKVAIDYANRIVDVVFAKNAEQLNEFAWAIVDSEADLAASSPLYKAALNAAKRADSLKGGKDPAIKDTLAKAYFENNMLKEAVETQSAAIDLAKGTSLEEDKDFKRRLRMYRRAMEAADVDPNEKEKQK